MKSKALLPFLFSLFFTSILPAQNYLRVEDPDDWNAINSNIPDWHQWASHGQFDEVTIIAEPQGIYTEIGFYATISQGPDVWSWQDEFEIIWQFELPGNTIVHDSWLWVDQVIVKADVVDYWTALETYEGIVDRNEDPSFFYQMPDNRYEIRIYPLPEGGSRRIKMSFLVPAKWDSQQVVSDLLQNLLQSSDYPPDVVGIGMPINDLWPSPGLKMNGVINHFTNTVSIGTGNPIHYMEVDGDDFVSADDISLVLPTPFSDNNSFVGTYSDAGENFFQLAYDPDWQSIIQASNAQKALILLDYDAAKTNLSIADVTAHLQDVLGAHFSQADTINIAIASTNGIQFLSADWVGFDEGVLQDTLGGFLLLQDTADLAGLLSAGFAWAQNQADVSEIILLAANDVYVYPPVADGVFAGLQASIPTDIPFTLLDYQNENVSILFYNNEEYHGNEYFYQLLTNGFSASETLVLRNTTAAYPQILGQVFPAFVFPDGIIDYYTTLENGVCYQRYSINESLVTPDNKGVLLQTGKYLGAFPMNIEATFITTDGDVWTATKTIPADDIVAGDTLMREIWYGPHLKSLEAQSSTVNEIQYIVEQSIQERVLTGFTAFLALEPSEGGTPCIDCLNNDGEGVLIDTEEVFDLSKAILSVTPNPASEYAVIQLIYADDWKPAAWEATIFDAFGRQVATLNPPIFKNGTLEWRWAIGEEVKAGIYFCRIKSSHGEIIGKIIVL